MSATSAKVDLRFTVFDSEPVKPKGTYTLDVHCFNCGWKGVGTFWRGQRASGRYECPQCGCREMHATGKTW